jgi:hypothetical protein
MKTKKSRSVKRKNYKPKKDENWISLLAKEFLTQRYALFPADVLNQIWKYYAVLNWQSKCLIYRINEEFSNAHFIYKWFRIYKSSECVEHIEHRYYDRYLQSDENNEYFWILNNKEGNRHPGNYYLGQQKDTHFEREFLVLNKRVRMWHDKEFMKSPYMADSSEDWDSIDDSTYDDMDDETNTDCISEKCNIDIPYSPYEIYMNAFDLYNSKLRHHHDEVEDNRRHIERLEKELKKLKYKGKYVYRQRVHYKEDTCYIKDYNAKTKKYTLKKKEYGANAIFRNVPENDIKPCGHAHYF